MNTLTDMIPYLQPLAPLIKLVYQIALDLSLVIFIYCIWQSWISGAWSGQGNIWEPIGRLIFTGAMLIGWPTIYALVFSLADEIYQVLMTGYHSLLVKAICTLICALIMNIMVVL